MAQRISPKLIRIGALWLALGACQTLETESPDLVGTDAGAGASGGGGAGGGQGAGFVPIGASGGGGAAGGGGATGGHGAEDAPGGSSGSGGGGSGGGGGAGAAGGSGPQGGHGGDPPPDCEELHVTAVAGEPGPISRSGVIEIEYSVPDGARVEGFADEGGLFTLRREGGLFYSPGGGVNGDDELQWPWFTGSVHLTVRATDDRGCQGEARTEVLVDGDVLVSDATSGALFALGSDGRVIGRWRQGGATGANDLILIPEADGGGYAYATPGDFDTAPVITRLTPEGRDDDTPYEMSTPNGLPLYEDNSGPTRLIFDPDTHELLGDNGIGGAVHRWRLDGTYEGRWDAPNPNGGTLSGRRSAGFARLEDGGIVFGVQDTREIYVLRTSQVRPFATFESPITGLGQGAAGTVVVVANDGGDVLYARIDVNGAGIDRVDVGREYSPHTIVPFRTGYLHSEPSAFQLRYHSEDLEVPEMQSDFWDQDFMERNGLDYARAILWLNR